MRVCAGLRHVAFSNRRTKRYLNMQHLWRMALPKEAEEVTG
jgi:hypothetical protein